MAKQAIENTPSADETPIRVPYRREVLPALPEANRPLPVRESPVFKKEKSIDFLFGDSPKPVLVPKQRELDNRPYQMFVISKQQT